MNRIFSALSAAAIAVVIGVTSFTTATAAPLAQPRIQMTSDIEAAQYRHRDDDQPRWKKRQHSRQDRVERGRDRRHDRVERRHDRPGYWNGHRGYREHRRGYRRHSDGYYYAPSVFQLFIR